MTCLKPKIHKQAQVARNATVVGDVTLDEDVTVLFNATLRGDCGSSIVVGARSNIQELACVHVSADTPTVIGKGVTVGHGAIVHGCTIGDGTLVGMGAIVLDGARIGNNCLIGAGALVTGKSDIPDGMLVIGSPAKATRALTAEELDSLAENAEEYVKIGRELVKAGLADAGVDDTP